MQTVLSEFCASFQAALDPMLGPLEVGAEALGKAPGDLPACRVLPALRDLRHEMQTLIDRVAEQQAYVLIFGPLKSGKSTFMNALSGTYVSEVTSLPAYPCMVYVRHSDSPGFVVTRYDGRTMAFTEREALREVVTQGHHELRRRIREVEAAGGTFDPAVQMPEAIRRIDVKIAIEDLARSGAVLVDTPGLYTRMKFGYDRMTRDFRNSAACAIFIVKTDNLFLEQVFDEFGELLELFSRIFIIVNVDSTKEDLLPDGTLAPSLEQQSPWEVIEAFERLSMTAPLKKAFEEGRLEIYPVDLLRAASRRIRGHEADAAEGGVETGQPDSQADFNDVLGDLTAFLDSNEYLTAFLDDSLRRLRTLIDELETVLRDDAVQELGREVAALRDGRDEAGTKVEAVHRLRQVEWLEHVLRVAPEMLDRVGGLAGAAEADAAGAVRTAIEQWFESANSVQHLLEQELLPIFADAHARLVRESEEALKRYSSEALTELAGGDDLLSDLDAAGVDILATAEAALGQLKTRAAAASPRPRLPSDAIPIRRSLSDWLLLRSRSKVRRRLFGPAERQDAEIPATVKHRLLGDPAHKAIGDQLIAQLNTMLDETARTFPDQLVRGYAEIFAHDLQSQLEAGEATATGRLQEIEQRLSDVQDVHDGLRGLSEGLGSVSPSVDTLIEQFGPSGTARSDRSSWNAPVAGGAV